MIYLKKIWNENFFTQLSKDDQKSLFKIYSIISLILLYAVFWDFHQLKAVATVDYLIVKIITIGTFILGAYCTYQGVLVNYWPFATSFSLLTYSLYGMLFIDFTYCYSFWETYFGVSVFFRSSKKAYLTIMSYGIVLNIIGLKLVSEPEFVKAGYSFKPHMIVVTLIVFILTNMLYYLVVKKREELFDLQEKFANIGKQSSYIFHEIKKPINRIMTSDNIPNDDIVKIKNILINIDLLLKNSNNFSESFSQINLKNIFISLETEFSDYLVDYLVYFQYPDKDLNIKANSELLYQVFKNLFVNAIEAMIISNHSDEIVRKIIVNYEQRENNKTYISFMNTGSGINNENSEKIFSPFYSTKSSSNHGLGLSFCKTIIEAHNGNISLVNQNYGPEFVIII